MRWRLPRAALVGAGPHLGRVKDAKQIHRVVNKDIWDNVRIRDDKLACAGYSARTAALGKLSEPLDCLLELQVLFDCGFGVVGRNPVKDFVAVGKRLRRPNDLRQLRAARLSRRSALRKMS